MIYLIRHGITRGNLEHLYYGSTDLPLASEGCDGLAQLHYTVPEGCEFVTSGMLRTEQTLQALFGAVPHTQDPRLREMDFGSFEMKSYEMLKEVPAYQAWITGDVDANTTPGGESGNQMRRRVLDGFREIVSRGVDTVVITHGGCIVAIMEALFPQENKNRYDWQPAPGHGYCISSGGYYPIP